MYRIKGRPLLGPSFYLVTFPGVAAKVGLTNRSLLYTLKFSPSSSFSLFWSAR